MIKPCTKLAFAAVVLLATTAPALATSVSNFLVSELVNIRVVKSVDRPVTRKFAGALRAHETLVTQSPADRQRWKRSLGAMSSKRGLDLVESVHQLFNSIPYSSDDQLDDWAAPAVFAGRGYGDCEDYALAKYEALRELGISADDMGIVVFIHPALRVAHASL